MRAIRSCTNFLGALVILASLSMPALAQVSGKFIPPDNKQLMVLGQDIDSIDGYRAAVGIEPAGVTTYINLADLSGLITYVDNGGGPNNAGYLQANYPNSVHAIAVYLKGQLNGVNNGTYDGEMDELIRILKSWERPVYLRWGYEADGPWNGYDPAAYRSAFIKMTNKVRAAGADNIAMVWQVASWCGGTNGGQPFTAWYPGAQYVDWIGLSYFAPQDCGWSAVNAVVNFARNENKPTIIAESAPQRYDILEGTYNPQVQRQSPDQPKSGSQIWNEWFANYFNFIETNSDVIKIAAYINADWDSQSLWAPPYPEGYWGDTRVQGNSTVLNNWKNEINNTAHWLPSSSSLFDQLGSGGGTTGGGTGGGDTGGTTGGGTAGGGTAGGGTAGGGTTGGGTTGGGTTGGGDTGGSTGGGTTGGGNGDGSANCPASHPFACNGACYTDSAQAESAGQFCSSGGGTTGGGTTGGGTTGGDTGGGTTGGGNGDGSANCPASHPFACEGGCYTDAGQAQSAGLSCSSSGGGGSTGGGSDGGGNTGGNGDGSANCPASHPYSCSGGCYTDAAQAQASGASCPAGGGNTGGGNNGGGNSGGPSSDTDGTPVVDNGGNGDQCHDGGSGLVVSGARTEDTQPWCDTVCVVDVGNGTGCLNAAGTFVSNAQICSDPANAKEAIIDIEFNLGINIDDNFIAQSGYQGAPPSLNPGMTLADTRKYLRALLGTEAGNRVADELNTNGDNWVDRNEASQAKGSDPRQVLSTSFGCGLSTDDILAYVGLYIGDGAIDKYAGDLDDQVKENMLRFTRSWQPGVSAQACEYRGGCN